MGTRARERACPLIKCCHFCLHYAPQNAFQDTGWSNWRRRFGSHGRNRRRRGGRHTRRSSRKSTRRRYQGRSVRRAIPICRGICAEQCSRAAVLAVIRKSFPPSMYREDQMHTHVSAMLWWYRRAMKRPRSSCGKRNPCNASPNRLNSIVCVCVCV